jgi:hypothetical protein
LEKEKIKTDNQLSNGEGQSCKNLVRRGRKPKNQQLSGNSFLVPIIAPEKNPIIKTTKDEYACVISGESRDKTMASLFSL